MLRTHHLGALTEVQIGTELVVCGWVERVREVGGISFVLLRDRYAKLQLSVAREVAAGLGREYCVKAVGNLCYRPEKDQTAVQNGRFELAVTNLEILSQSALPPFVIDDKEAINEELRLKYRYLDLRRDFMKENVLFAHSATCCFRDTLNNLNFIDIETPLMMKSTPEGSRDFLVPSRIYPGQFYALPQSPQLYKQMLMVGGMDRYYQFARCFRDEDARKDRQIVHTQIDIEMSFITEDDIFSVVEKLFSDLFVKVLNKPLPAFQRLTYDECMTRFGSDKPDLRFGMELFDLADILQDSSFPTFIEMAKQGRIAGFVVKNGHVLSRKQLDELSEYARSFNARGIFYTKMVDNVLNGGVTKHLAERQQAELIQKTALTNDDLLIFVAEETTTANAAIGNLRHRVAKLMDIIPEDKLSFLWVTDFPLFEFEVETQQWQAKHHMFTLPKKEHLQYFASGELDKIYGHLYDLVLNGVELGSGSLRIYDVELQKQVFKIIGLSEEQVQQRFGFFLESLTYGAPPHGGIALGLGRLLMTLLGLTNIRDVIAFPNASSSRYLLDDSPTEVTAEQLQELNLRCCTQESPA